METTDPKNRDEFEKWFSDKPHFWSPALTIRASLRTFPSLDEVTDELLAREASVLFRALIVACIANDEAASLYTYNAANSAYFSLDYVDRTFRSLVPKHTAARRAVTAAARTALRNSLVFEAMFADATAAQDEFMGETSWEHVIGDVAALVRLPLHGDIPPTLAHEPLWKTEPPTDWQQKWRSLSGRLKAIDPNFDVWIEWFQRRVDGQRSSFNLGDGDQTIKDRMIFFRLINAKYEDFWGKGHEYVNATLKGWLDDARERAAPPPIIGEASDALEISGAATGELESLPPPAQNRNALSFRADEYGRITIDTTALADQLRFDAGAQDRHAEAIAEAKIVLDRCERSNAGARLTRLFENYLAAASETIEGVKPSLLVQRGERLRQELEAYTNPDSFLDPLADDLLLDMKGWQSAHNMMVGLDPVLNAMDTAILGPDRQPSLMPPDEIRQKSEAADEAGILADNVAEVLIEAADLAPTIPDPNDRRTILSNEMMRNLIIEAFSVAMNNPKKAVVGIVVTGVAVSAMPVGTTLLGVGGGAMAAAGFLVREREWIEKQMGNTPAWRDLFLHVSKLIEEKTHFKLKSSDKSE